MKKKYTKPEIVFESFLMNTSIAGDCNEKVDTYAEGKCGIPFSTGAYLFLEGIEGCEKKLTADDELYNSMCYHNPSQGEYLFNS